MTSSNPQITQINNPEDTEKLKREEIITELGKVPVCTVSTYSGTQIKNRMMHFAVTQELKFYLTSLKNDPKTQQLLFHTEISLLAYLPGENFPGDKEIEVTGQAKLIIDETQRKEAINLLLPRSPVVATMVQSGHTDMLTFIEVSPVSIKYRIVKDILQGIPPTVFEFNHRVSIESDWYKFTRKLQAWISETRFPFLTVTILPVILGTAVAWMREKTFNLTSFILTLFGTAFLHLGTNIINDYFDHKSGNDEANTEYIRPFSGGSRIIQLGLLTPLEVLTGALLFFILGSLIGLYLSYHYGLPILLLGLIGVISGLFYTAPVVNWGSRGFGELLVGLNFGVLVCLGSFYVQTGYFSPEVLLISLPLGILVTAILWINEIPDYNADKKVGKNTLVVRLGRPQAAQIYLYIMLSAYFILTLSAGLGYIPKITLIGLLSLPLALKAIAYARKFYTHPQDMAVGNGLTILCFNILSFIFILTYLWLSSFSKPYFTLILILSVTYLWWTYRTIMVHKDIAQRIKSIS